MDSRDHSACWFLDQSPRAATRVNEPFGRRLLLDTQPVPRCSAAARSPGADTMHCPTAREPLNIPRGPRPVVPVRCVRPGPGGARIMRSHACGAPRPSVPRGVCTGSWTRQRATSDPPRRPAATETRDPPHRPAPPRAPSRGPVSRPMCR